jgi:hypothetical protein
VAIDTLGEALAIELAQKLADIEAVDSVAELERLYPDGIQQAERHTRSLELTAGGRLQFRPSHLRTPLTPDGRVEWRKVTRVRITAVEVTE